MSIETLRKFIKEEIGRNFHTLRSDPYTFVDFQDYTIEIDGSTDGGFFLTIFFEDEKLFPTSRFSTYDDAHHHARMVVDNDRVKRLNA